MALPRPVIGAFAHDLLKHSIISKVYPFSIPFFNPMDSLESVRFAIGLLLNDYQTVSSKTNISWETDDVLIGLQEKELSRPYSSIFEVIQMVRLVCIKYYRFAAASGDESTIRNTTEELVTWYKDEVLPRPPFNTKRPSQELQFDIFDVLLDVMSQHPWNKSYL